MSGRSTASSRAMGVGGGGSSAVMIPFLAVAAVGVVIYLALVGGGLTAAFLATVVLKGVRLI
jgi:hypothetical protein